MANFCKHCGAQLAEGAAFCPSCGAKQEAPAPKAFCVSCGAELAEGAKFCKKCGTPVAPAPSRPQKAYCAVCGAELTEGARFCKVCGASADSAAPAKPVNPAAQAGYAHQNVQTTYASDRARQAQPVYQQPAYQQPAQPYAQAPAATKPKKKRGFLLLFLLIWAGLLYLGYRWVPDAVKDARLPIVPAVSEEEVTEEQREEYAELGTVIPSGDLDELEEEEPASFVHEAYAWLYGALAMGEEGDE